MREQLHQRAALLTREGVGLLLGRQAAAPQHHGHHAPRNETGENFIHVAVGIFRDVAQDAALELLLVERGLEVDHKAVALLVPIAQVCARGEYQRPGHAEVREEHFTELAEEGLGLLAVDGELHVPQREPLHRRAVGAVALKRNERAARGDDHVTKRLCHAVAVTGRAGRGVGDAARRENDGLRRVARLFAENGAHRAALRLNRERAVPHDAHMQPPQPPLQRAGDVE